MVLHRKSGFTLLELLTVMGIVTVLFSIVAPSLFKIREIAKRSTCLGALSAISKGAFQFASQNNRLLPTFSSSSSSTAALGHYYMDPNASDDDGNTRQWYLLVTGGDTVGLTLSADRTAYVPSTAFVCPADTTVRKNVMLLRENYDFPGNESRPTISYSFAVTKTNKSTGAGVRVGLDDPGDLAVLADHNGAAEWKGSPGAWHSDATYPVTWNSPNHSRDGQNVMFLNGGGAWKNTSNCGVDGDNIWTGAGGEVDGVYPVRESSGSTKDSYLRP